MTAFKVWTDGSGTTGGPAGIGYWGYALTAGQPEVSGSLPLRDATNQQAEILAVAYALHQLPDESDVDIVSDSEYVVLGWNEPTRLFYWRQHAWRKKDGGTVKNVAHWQRLIAAADRHRIVSVQWTRGHVGTEGNEMADSLARAARMLAKAQTA